MSNVQEVTREDGKPTKVINLPTKVSKTSKGTKGGKAAKVAGKPKKVVKAKKATKATGRKLDQFGFVAGKKRSKVAEMYARTEGASTSEVKRKHGHPHLNMLKSVEARGKKDKDFKYTVMKDKRENKAGRVVTIYHIVTKGKAKAA